jgi:hypothetical protein
MCSHDQIEGLVTQGVLFAEVAIGLVDRACKLCGEVALCEAVGFVIIGVGQDGIIDDADAEASAFERFAIGCGDADLDIGCLAGGIGYLIA